MIESILLYELRKLEIGYSVYYLEIAKDCFDDVNLETWPWYSVVFHNGSFCVIESLTDNRASECCFCRK